MRWLNTQQRRLPRSYQDGSIHRALSGSIGGLYPAAFLKLFRTIKQLPTRCSAARERFYYFISLVNNFTYYGRPALAISYDMSYNYAPSSQPAPSRTIRRVHVMPWATPIRRIGSMRINCIGSEGDDPAGSGRRRF